MKTDKDTMMTLSNCFEWIKINLNNLQRSYSDLEHEKIKDLPFPCYCIAMYLKHQSITN